MAEVLLAHGFHLAEDPREARIMRPHPPLGLLYLAAYLRRAGLAVEVFDGTFGTPRDFSDRLARTRPAVVGLYANMLTRRRVVAMAAEAGAAGATVVVGGPEPVNYPEDYLRRGAHYIVAGEGEETLLELVRFLAGAGPGEGPEKVAGLLFLDGAGELVRTPPRPAIRGLDELPWPEREAIDLEAYFSAWRRHHGASCVSMITARGCPFTCRWCSHAVYGHSHRRRSPAAAADELEGLVDRYRPDTVWYADDVFTISKPWIQAYAAELDKRSLRVPFETITREDRLDEATLDALAHMGCHTLWIGAESGSQRILDEMDRRTSAVRLREVMAAARRRGISVGTFIMVGYEGEEPADLRATARHLAAARPDRLLVTTAYPIKGTPYYERVRDRITVPRDWDWSQGSDRDYAVAGRRTRSFYDAAHRWLVNGVELRRELSRRPPRLARVVRHGARWLKARLQMALRSRQREPLVRRPEEGRAVGGAPFDGVAADYDESFARRPLGRVLRGATHRWGEELLSSPPEPVLDLGCGTGEDLLWLLERGHRAHGVDASAAMLAVARAKLEGAGGSAVRLDQLDLNDGRALEARLWSSYGAVWSNFGVLNCVVDRPRLARALAARLAPGRPLVVVTMGRWCAWEVLWHGLRGEWRAAFRRRQTLGAAAVGAGRTVMAACPTARRLARDFAPWFTCRAVVGVGVFLPPPHLGHLVEDRPRRLARLARLDDVLGARWPFSRLADHQLIHFERTAEALR